MDIFRLIENFGKEEVIPCNELAYMPHFVWSMENFNLFPSNVRVIFL